MLLVKAGTDLIARRPTWASPIILAAGVLLGGSVLDPKIIVSAEPPASGSARPQDGDSGSQPRASLPTVPRPAPPTQSPPHEHPLAPLLRWAAQELAVIEAIHDYSATVVKRDRIGGKLRMYEYMAIKIRHKPFSVYLKFLSPTSVQGQEVIYVEGRNNGDITAHSAHSSLTVSLPPEGSMAMEGERYPVTQIGLLNLVRRMVAVGQEDVKHDECNVKYFSGAKLNERICTVIQIEHPVRRDIFHFHFFRLFVDDGLKLPTRYELYDWPQQPSGSPVLLEECTYLDLKLNNGFTDADFSPDNPKYHFQTPGRK
jgi:hypothetical protein